MSDFTTTPTGARLSHKPRTLNADFGDGYEQRAGDGVNVNLEMWDLSFAYQATADADTIETFLEGKAGVTNFTWTPPNRSEITVICRSWQRSYRNGAYQDLACRFEQVPE